MKFKPGGLVLGARRARIFMHQHFLDGDLSEKEEISSDATVWTKMPCGDVKGEFADWVEMKERQQ